MLVGSMNHLLRALQNLLVSLKIVQAFDKTAAVKLVQQQKSFWRGKKHFSLALLGYQAFWQNQKIFD